MQELGGEADMGAGGGGGGGGGGGSGDGSGAGGGNPEARLREGPSLAKHVLVRARTAFRVEALASSGGVSVRRMMEGEAVDDGEGVMGVGDLQILPYGPIRAFLIDGTMEAQ
jgi:hypothetical protein